MTIWGQVTRACQGLSTAGAAVRLALDGQNVLPRPLLRDHHLFAIIIVIFVKTVVACIPESRADRAAERLASVSASLLAWENLRNMDAIASDFVGVP